MNNMGISIESESDAEIRSETSTREFKIKNILWPNIQTFFEQQSCDDMNKKGNIIFQCILCKPKMNFITASHTSNSNLRKSTLR